MWSRCPLYKWDGNGRKQSWHKCSGLNGTPFNEADILFCCSNLNKNWHPDFLLQLLRSSLHLCRRCWMNWTSWKTWWFCSTRTMAAWRTPNTWPPSAPSPRLGSLTPTPWRTAGALWRPCWRASPASIRTGLLDTWLKCFKPLSGMTQSSFSENWTPTSCWMCEAFYPQGGWLATSQGHMSDWVVRLIIVKEKKTTMKIKVH